MASTTLTPNTLSTTGTTLTFQTLTAGETHSWTDGTVSPGVFVLFQNTSGANRTVTVNAVKVTLDGTSEHPTLSIGAITRVMAPDELWELQPVPSSHRNPAGLSTFTVTGAGLSTGDPSGVQACAKRRGV
jgi:hypothetical protein